METTGRCFLSSASLTQRRCSAAVGELPPQQQERSRSLDQEDTGPSHIKEEQEDLWSSQEGQEEIYTIKVKSEDDDDSMQLHQIKTEQTESDADERDCEGLEPAWNSDPESDLLLQTGDRTEDTSEPETDDCEEWRYTTEHLNSREKTNKRTKTDGISHSCSECRKTFKEKSYLDTHMRIHTGEKPFSCSECGKNFNQRGNLIQHARIHQNEKPFSCSECGKSFKLKGNLLQHMKIHQSEKPFSCSECAKAFKQKGTLKQHMRIHQNEKPFSCSECGKTFTSKWQLSAHMLVHTGEKLFSCAVCNKGFKRQHDLTRHLLVHSGEKPFNCTECDKGFYQKFHLTTHMLLHTGEKPYSCPECHRKFKQKFHLTKHMIVHTGEKPFSCSECDKTFFHKSNLTKHLANHRGEKPFSCKVCDQRFSWCTQLKRHKCFAGQASELQAKTGADGEDCGGRKSAGKGHLQPEIEVTIEDFSDPESEQSDDELWATRDDQSSLNSLGNDDIPQSAETFEQFTEQGSQGQQMLGPRREKPTETELPLIKEKPELPFTLVTVKSEGVEEALQISRLHEVQTEKMETEANEEDREEPTQVRSCDPERRFQPKTEVKTED